MRRVILFAALVAAPAMFAGRVPHVYPNEVTVHVGETVDVRATAAINGLNPSMPTRWDWHFWSTDPRIAAIDGSLRDPNTEGVVRITGLAEGVTGIATDGGYLLPSPVVTVVCGESVPVSAATPVVTVKLGQKTMLHAIAQQSAVTMFQWYSGRINDTLHPREGNGPDSEFATNAPGTYYVWVRVTTPCATSAAEFRIDVPLPKRRSVR